MEPAVVFAIGVLLAALVFAAIYASKKSKTVSPAKLAQLQSEAKEFIDKVVATGKITVPDGIPVVLGTDEAALLHEPSKLIEARATRVYAGAGTRVKGIYVGGGESRSVQSLKVLDSGTLTLTTKRPVFTGSMESRVVNVKDVVSLISLLWLPRTTNSKMEKYSFALKRLDNREQYRALMQRIEDSTNEMEAFRQQSLSEVKKNAEKFGQ